LGVVNLTVSTVSTVPTILLATLPSPRVSLL
jgi:hypothetical protein